jgi:hypothetical protein
MLNNPYQHLPARSFWRSAVGDPDPTDIVDLWTPKFRFSPEQRVATAGSCFAQHIGRALAKAGFTWLDGEPAPFGLSDEEKSKFGYGVFSFRVGNIYTVALLRQWLNWAFGVEPQSTEVWEQDGRFFDPFRPVIEPAGFRSADEMFAMRAQTLDAIRRVVRESNVFVFTLGLTEGWVNAKTGHAYPLCPGTTVGRSFDPDQDEFINYSFVQIRDDLLASINLMSSVNPDLRFLLTVSPVPLTATASDKHVLVATIYSKSTLRAVAGEVASMRPDTDYFPSYEIISSFPFGGRFYDRNKRTVRAEGVRFVMSHFFAGIGGVSHPQTTSVEPGMERAAEAAPVDPGIEENREHDDVVCEEALLEAFGRRS